MFHTIRNGVAHVCTKATPKRFVLDVDSIYFCFPHLWNLEGFRYWLFDFSKVLLLYVLLKEVFPCESSFVHVLFETGVDVVHVEVSHVFDMIVTEHTFPVWCDRAMKHTDPFGIAVAMYAGFMSFPAIRVFERFWARSAMVCLTCVESAIARDMRW
ncbi:hypothetical protein HBI26_187820 [Parastagonospora nodorum]|nr:hypothetical protein HBH51_047690 [Parastagonospora nodorum]KAH5023226.1 hypothetical protein HBI74_134610 [Parastagonospora nodorum]KAH5479961.1 hypothetical protein HBI28_033200 [Parastagonospora nodorum]KAH5508390.1 hypothetical protein HBI31_040730 [Parastagonospora nodorum]KAH5561909.1 hypothetical protein HBI26_187820 [Parastagonospora nodorum]